MRNFQIKTEKKKSQNWSQCGDDDGGGVGGGLVDRPTNKNKLIEVCDT